MIKQAQGFDAYIIADMQKAMLNEVFGDKSSDNIEDYRRECLKEISDPLNVYLLDEDINGYVKLRDVSSPLVDMQRWDLQEIYIKPEKRGSRLYAQFRDYLRENFKGDVVGMTEISSNHIPMLMKHQELIGMVFKLN